MKQSVLNPLYSVLLSVGLAGCTSLSFAEEPMQVERREQSPVAESVQSQVDQETADEALKRRKQVLSEAASAITQTKNALAALEEAKTDDALSALELATGKLELILARDPDLAFAPVDVSVVTFDLIADPDTIQEAIDEAQTYLEKGEVQRARPLVASLASETVVETTSIPLATYPTAIKSVVPLIDEGKLDEAKAALQAALNTLVVTTDTVIPLPIVRAEWLLAEAETLAEEEDRTAEDSERLADLLQEARVQLEMAEVLGYGKGKAFEPMYEQLDEIEAKTAGGKGGTGWFDTIKKQVSELF